MIPTQFAPIASHIWQSTLFAAAAVLLTLALRRNQARVRYAILLAASYKFLIPFSWLVSLGRQFEWRTAPAALPHAVSTVTDVISAPAFLMPTAVVNPAPHHLALIPWAIWLVWGCGVLIIVVGWTREWLRIRAVVRAAKPLLLALPIPVVSVPSRLEPGVFGIFRPVLLLPEGIAEKLSPAQMRAVLAHELCHVHRRDNLAAALQMLVEAVFWFHPLVWWLDARMIDERERACDEEVLRMGGDPTAYVETILAVCKSYVESPITCMSGISGAGLKRRVVNVMANRRTENLGPVGRLLFSVLGIVAVVLPIAFGAINAPRLSAQSAQTQPVAAPQSFEVASVKKHKSDSSADSISTGCGRDPGRCTPTNVTAKNLIGLAYGVRDFQVLGGPAWIKSETFDIEATVGDPAARQLATLSRTQQQAEMALMMRSLLADRFKLKVTQGTKQLPAYALVVTKGGSKLTAADTADRPTNSATGSSAQGRGDSSLMPTPGQSLFLMDGGQMTLAAKAVLLSALVNAVSRQVGRQVVDETGLTGLYDYKLQFVPEMGPRGEPLSPEEGAAPSDSDSTSIFTALQEQLGLRLEPTTAPIDTITIEHIEEPTPD